MAITTILLLEIFPYSFTFSDAHTTSVLALRHSGTQTGTSCGWSAGCSCGWYGGYLNWW